MKSGKLMCIAAMTLLALLVIPVRLAAQGHQDRRQTHHQYRLVDIGTFGGPDSYILPAPVIGSHNQINNRGITVGGAATPAPTTSTNNGVICTGVNFNSPFVHHALQWQNGAVTDLGSLAGADYCSIAGSINTRREISGTSENGVVDPVVGLTELRAVVWKDGGINDLGTLGGNVSMAAGINNRGQVVGFALNGIADPFSIYDFQFWGLSNGTQTRAFLWQNGHMHDLGDLGGPDSYADFVNESGQVAGSSYTNSTPNPVTGLPTTHPFLWEKGHGMTDLGSLGGTLAGSEVANFQGALNNLGHVTGGSTLAGDLIYHPFFWKRGKPMRDLGTLGGDCGTALAINDADEVVGGADLPSPCNLINEITHAFLWKPGMKKMKDLGTVGGDTCSGANAINSRGQVVGNSFNCDFSTQHPFLWEMGQLIDLNTLIPHNSVLYLTQAFAINDRGEIAGIGKPHGCSFDDICGHAFVLIPCDDGRSHAEDCEGDAEGTAAVPQISPSLVMQNPTTSGPSPNERMSGIRARLAHRYPYRGFGTYQPK
jgi:probable HAF family extracellular repeat protein